MVLLKNDAGTLPLKKGTSLVVVGQSVNRTEAFMTGNYNGPLCPRGSPGGKCFPGLIEEAARLNTVPVFFDASVCTVSSRRSFVAVLVVVVADVLTVVRFDFVFVCLAFVLFFKCKSFSVWRVCV
jgi:hypothetical protein